MNQQTTIDLVGFRSEIKYQKDYDIFKKFMSYHQAKISGHLPPNLSLSDEEQESFRLFEKQFSIMSHEEIDQFCKQVERRHAHMRQVELRQSAANQSTSINDVDMFRSKVEHIGSKTTADSLVSNQETTLEGSLANMTPVGGRTVESAGTKASGYCSRRDSTTKHNRHGIATVLDQLCRWICRYIHQYNE